MPLPENDKLQNIQKDIFYSKPVIFRFVQKPFIIYIYNFYIYIYIYITLKSEE